MLRSILDVQRDFARSCGFRSEIIWDSLASDQFDILKEKIKTLIPDSEKHQKYRIEARDNIFENVWAQRIYTNRNLLSTIIYVLVTDETSLENAPQATSFTCHPVFRTRKCLNANNSLGCCMIFVDEHGRIYQNWQHYLDDNRLPSGTLVSPANGIYMFDDDDEVKLECHATPASGTGAKVLEVSDTVASITGLVAMVPIAVALVCPVAAPIMLTATAISMTTAVYSTVRSGMHLADRQTHGQSMALSNREARNSWIGIAGGVVGVGGTGATQALNYASIAGQDIALATKIAVNGINVSSLLISGTGVANGVYDLIMKINDDENVNSLDILHLASSLIVFTHSINNIIIASKVATTENTWIARNELTKQLRNAFNKISEEISQIRNPGSSNLDIIRIVNDVPVKNTLMTLHRLNSHLTDAGGARNEFGSSMLHKIILHFANGNTQLDLLKLAEEYGHKFVQHIGNPSSLLDVLNAMAKYLSECVIQFLMNLSRTFIDNNVDMIDRVLNTYISTETVLYKILSHCISNYSDFSLEYLNGKTLEILTAIETYFESLNPIDNTNPKLECKTCNGYYYICKL